MPNETIPERLSRLDKADLTLNGLVRRHAVDRPHAPALSFEGRTWSYSDLDAEFAAAAMALRASGIARGDRIACLAKNTAEFAFLWGGAAMIGAVIVPLNWRLAPSEIIDILVDAEASALFIAAPFLALEAELASGAARLRLIVHCEQSGPRGYRAWIAEHAGSAPVEPSCDNEDVAIQLYTSGTTGRAKGVLLTHRSVFWQRAASIAADVSWDSHGHDDVLLVSLTISHVGGLVTFARGFYSGGHVVLLREFETGAVLDAVTKMGVSRVIAVPSTLQMLLRDPLIAQTDTSSVKILQYGASPMPLDLLIEGLEVFGCEFVQVYGMTEMAGTVATLPPQDHDVAGNERMKSIGVPLPGVEMRIADGDDREVTVGTVGEIQVRARSMMSGYWKMPDETRKAISPDGWLRTGDAGYMDKDGYFYLCDRIKDMIVTGGENVYPAEVERVLHAHPGVVEAAVIGVPDTQWGEAVKAVVVRQPDSDVSAEELVEHVRKHIARFKVPKSFDFVDELPRNSSGKVMRRQLREPYWVGMERQIN